MSTSKITMIGLETALAYRNESLFDLMNLPNGIDKDVVECNILMEGGEFEVLYADPNFMRQMIGIWAQKHYRTFDKWIKALNIEYSPLENYDRMEEWTDTGSETSNRKNNGTLTDTSNGNVHVEASDHDNEHISSSSNMEGNTSTNTEGETENTVSAFDSSTYQPENKSENTNKENSETSEHSTDSNDRTFSHNNSTDTSTTNTTNGNTTNNEDYLQNTTGLHKGRTHGNIGVTTSQQMLQSELDIARFNIVQQITDLFLQEFCIMIYS